MAIKKIKILALFALCLIYVNSGFAQCSFSGLAPSYCVYSPTTQLTSTVSGGVFSGPGVTGSVFDPALAGPGTHTISYSICGSTYTVTSGTFSPFISGSTSTVSSTTTTTEGTSVTLSDDQITTTSSPIGFNFQFFCNTYNSFYISSNGFITFSSGQSQGCCNGATIPSTVSPNNYVALAWTDLYPPAGGTITYTTIGSSPNRILIVSYNSIDHYNGASFCCPITTQVKIFETSNVIEIHTTTKPLPTSTTYSTTMGIENSTGTSGYAVSGRNASSTWTATNEMYRFTPLPGCISTQTVYVSPSSIPVSGNMSVCTGGTAALLGSGNTTYSWSTSSNASSITVTPSVTTTYSVSGTNSFGCIANSAITVTVNTALPSVTAVASNTTNGICPGTTLSLNASGAITYSWSNGVANTAAFSPTLSDTYTVTGANGCGTATAAVSVSIHPLPPVTASISSPTICSGSTVIVAGGGASSYTWSPTVGNGILFTPTVSTNYTVIGTSALGCTASAITSLTIFQTPSVTPVASATLICIGNSATLSAAGASAYNWMPGSSTSSLLIVTPTITTTYTLVQSNSNCSDTRLLTVTVNQLPNVLSIVSPTLICAMNSSTLGGGGGTTYTWTAPGFTTTGFAPIVLPAVSTTYTMTASDGTCVNTSTVFLAVNPNPTLNISTSSATICAGESATLTVGGALNYTWTAPVTATGTSAVVTPTASSQFFVTGDNSFGCTSTISQVILVKAQPTVNATTNKLVVCSGGSATLTAGGTANSYSWSTGQTTNTIIVNPLSTTVYTVIGTTSLTGCTKKNTVTVHIFTPTIAVSANTAVCQGGSALISASGALTYTWSTGSTLNNTTVSPTVQTIYTLSATSNSNGLHCVGTNTVQVGIYPNPTVTAGTNKAVICKGEKATLTGYGAFTYVWSNTVSGTTVQVSPFASTLYSVTGTDTNGCVNTATVQVKFSICAGIDELSSASQFGLTIYPNPNNGEFTVESLVDLDLTLINELGQTITSIKLSELNSHKAHLTNIANGVYFITGEKDRRPINQKLIILK